MMKSVSTILASLSLAVLAGISTAATAALPAVSRAGSGAPAWGEEPAAESKVRSAIERLKAAPALERRRAVADLIALGPGALAEARRERDGASDPGVRSALERAVRWILAAKMEPVLEERSKTGLTFDGQFDDLKAEGPEAAEALLCLFDDEETLPDIRFAAAHALADIRDPSVLPRIRRIEEDPLLSYRLREEAGTLMAILGDTSRLDRKIKDLSEKAERKVVYSRSDIESLNQYYRKAQDNIDLSNLYYRIRQYRKAVECYDRAIKALEDIRPTQKSNPRFDRELALTYYNAACSLCLNGELERAREMLRKAVKVDSTFLKSIDRDGDLRRIREAPGFDDFRRELESPLEKKSI